MSNNGEPETFDEFVKEMKEEKYWKEEIIPPDDLKKKSSNFFFNYIQVYSTNCLFLELLDLQISLSKEFPFIYPVYDDISISIIRKLDVPGNSYIISRNLMDDVDKLIKRDDIKDELLKFLTENPTFDYYFWNVTFPNICLGFISDEYCKIAVNFLTYFENKIEIFLKGVASFVFHNYYFQDSLMKSFFINSKVEKDKYELILQKSLKKAIQKLTIQQLEMLERIIDNHPDKANDFFLQDIIIRSINLWKYSPLYSPFRIGDKEGKYDLLNYINEHFINGENHVDELNKFLAPIFEAIKNKSTINKIEISRLIINTPHKIAYTFLDILIIEKVNNNSTYKAQIGPLLEKFKDSYLCEEAFSYWFFEKNLPCPDELEKKMKVNEPSLDTNYVNKWKVRCEDCRKHNINPLEIFIIDKERLKFLEQDPELAYAGIAYSRYEWKKYSNTKEALKEESRALIPFKSILESQGEIMDIYCTYYASTYPISHDNFLEGLKDLLKKTMKNIILKYIKIKFMQSKYYTKIKAFYNALREENRKKNNPKLIFDEKKVAQLESKIESYKEETAAKLDEVSKKYDQMIDNEFSQNFDLYFNDKKSAENLYNLTSRLIKELIFQLDSLSNISIINTRPAFDKYIEHMQSFTKSYLIVSYSDAKISIFKPSIIKLDGIEYIRKDPLSIFAPSGVFDYISDLVYSLKSDDFEKTKMIPIGQVFAAVPTINNFLKQFTENKPEQFTTIYGTEEDIVMKILIYAFKFFSNRRTEEPEGAKEEEVEKNTNYFIEFLTTALNVLDSLKGSLPYFEKLRDEFLFLMKFIPI